MRFGHRVPARVLELELDASLEALTIVVPALPSNAVPALQMSDDGFQTCCAWTDTCGKHSVLVSSPGAPRAEFADLLVDCDLSWWIEPSVLKPVQKSPTAYPAMGVRYLEVAGVEQRAAGNDAAESGMMAFAAMDGRWRGITVDEPCRGTE